MAHQLLLLLIPVIRIMQLACKRVHIAASVEHSPSSLWRCLTLEVKLNVFFKLKLCFGTTQK